MSISGDTVVIGDPYDSHDASWSGSAYVFVKDGSGWVQQQKLFVKEDLAESDFFGVSVAVHGSTIIAGNSGADEQRGAVYIFTADDKLNWSQQTKLVAGDGLIEDHFGTAVASNGSEVLVGATGKNVTGPSSGAVYYTGH